MRLLSFTRLRFRAWLPGLLLLAGPVLAQPAATEAEKTSIRQVLRNYEKVIQILADPGSPENKKASAHRELSVLPEDPGVFVTNDLDSSGAGEFVTVQHYFNAVLTAFPVQTVLGTDKASIGPVQTDKLRRYQWVEVKAMKTLSWSTVQPADSGRTDTVQFARQVPLSFFVRFDRGKPAEKYKLFAISKVGEAPKLIPLPPLVAWWGGLDPAWRDLLRKRFKLDEYPSNDALMMAVGAEKLSIANAPVKDAQALEPFVNLRVLDLSGTQISDIAPLARLTWLEELNLSNSGVKDFKALASLKNLRYLNLSYLKLTALPAGLSALPKLEELHFSNNEVADLSPLANATSLHKLNFVVNQVTDLTPLKNLANLEELRFSKNKIQNFTALAQLPNLIILDMYSTNCADLEVLRNHRKIAELVVGGNPITDLSPIAGYHFIMKLNIAITKVQSLGPIGRYSQLDELDCSNTDVSDLGPLNDLPNVRELKCHLTKIDVGNKDRFKKKHPGCQITYY
jgi:hypothetical protein